MEEYLLKVNDKKTMSDKITVIIPSYNSEENIIECLESIRKQSYFNYEVIIINDGSSDNSPGIIRNYIKTNQKFKLVSQENKGVSSARNLGLSLATGKYIVFIDSDDWVEDNYLEILYKKIKSSNYDIVFHNTIYFRII